jgi:hypothetical protein
MWSRGIFWVRIAAAIFAAGAGLLTALDFYGAITLSPKFEPAVWAVSLVIIGGDNIGTLISRKFHSNQTAREKQIDKALMGLLISLAETQALRFEHLGASVYVSPWWDRSNKRLKRVRRFRPAGYPLQSGISWTSVTGAVGECWTAHAVVHKDWSKIARKYHGVILDEAQFAKVSVATRHGFTCEQFNAIAGKYSEILAVPVWHGRNERRQIGVLTIDRAFQEDEATFTARLNIKGNIDVASATASAVGTILKPTKETE